MITTEIITIDGREYVHTYGDTYKIRKIGTNEFYEDAMDVQDFTYEETDIPLDVHTPTEEDKRDALAILGVSL